MAWECAVVFGAGALDWDAQRVLRAHAYLGGRAAGMKQMADAAKAG